MYGGVAPTQLEKQINQRFIDEAVKKSGSREAACEQALASAWNWVYKKDFRTAMRRFNQAWLLNPEDARVFHGFGSVLGEMGDGNGFVKWNRQSAEMGWGNAQVNMGWAYLIGYGVKQDPKAAAQWYQKAADQNHPTGLNDLGILYDWGYGVNQDTEKAKKLYAKADEQGFDGPWKKLRHDRFQQENPDDKNAAFEEIVQVLRDQYFKSLKIRTHQT